MDQQSGTGPLHVRDSELTYTRLADDRGQPRQVTVVLERVTNVPTYLLTYYWLASLLTLTVDTRIKYHRCIMHLGSFISLSDWISVQDLTPILIFVQVFSIFNLDN